MRNDLPISPKKKFKYSISFESWDEESLEAGQSDVRGYEVEDDTDTIGDILYKANTTYGIYYPLSFGGWESTEPDEDRDFWEKGIRKYYALHITNEDGTEISQEESDFITFLLSDGRYEIDKFLNYAVGGIVLGTVALGVGALIAYFYFKDKKPKKVSVGKGKINNRAKSVTHTINGKERKFPIKDAWKREHSLENKSEKYEVPQAQRFENGGFLRTKNTNKKTKNIKQMKMQFADGGGVSDIMTYKEMKEYEKGKYIHYNPMGGRWEVWDNGKLTGFWNQEKAQEFAGIEYNQDEDSRYSRKKYEALFGYANGGGVGNTLPKDLKKRLDNVNKYLKKYNGRELTEQEAIMWNVFNNSSSGWDAGNKAFYLSDANDFHTASNRVYHLIGDALIDISRKMTGVEYDNIDFRNNTEEENLKVYNEKYKNMGNKKFAEGGNAGDWSVTDITNAKYLGVIEFEDNEGEFHNFEIMETDDRLVFGGMTNSGFIESGYIEKDGFSTDETLQSLLEDLEVYYNDGAEYTSQIVFNQRMAKGGEAGGKKNTIKDWYIKNYPTDDLGEELNEITFEELWNEDYKKYDIYQVMGVADSVIRERLFEHLAEIKGVSYDDVYNKLFSSDGFYAGGGEAGSFSYDYYEVYDESTGKSLMIYAIDQEDAESIAEELDFESFEDGDEYNPNEDEYAKGGGINDCIEYIKNSESIKNNGYYLHIDNLLNYVGANSVNIPKINSLCMITFKSGGQKNLKAVDTINSTILASEISKLLNIDIEIARIIVYEQTTYSKPFTMDMLKNIENKNIIVADRDKIVCDNLSNDTYAKGGGVEKRSLMSVAHLVDWKEEGIKKWYIRSYPKDDLGEQINDTNTFKDLWDGLHQKKDVYQIIGVGDSVVRERLFEYLSLIYDVDYSYVYDKWLESDDEYAEGGEVEDWMEEALESLIEETGFDDLEITIVSDNGNEFYATDGDAEYRVFKTEDDAKETAIEQVREDLEESPENFNKDFISNYIDGRDFFESALDEMNLGYAEDIKSESDDIYANRLIQEMVENGILNEDDALSGNAEELADYYMQDFVNLMTEGQLDEGNDGLDYFISNFGEEYTMELVIDNNLIDVDEASQDAVDTDGIGHFLSSYDGETVYLSNDSVAYRVN